MNQTIKPFIIGGAFAIVLVLAIVGVTGYGVTRIPTGNAVTNTVVPPLGEFQEVTLTFENYRYKLEPSTLIKDMPVRMTVDLDTVYGCMRDVVISQFGVRKYVDEKDNVITFTPDKTGTFNIACSMNMGRGTFDVAESDGTASAYIEPVKEGVSCGTEGSCGCGGGV